MSNCTNRFGCAGISFKDGFCFANIKINNKNIFLGKYKLREDAIVARMMANKQYGLNDKRRLYNTVVMLRDIFATETKPINYTIQANSNYRKLVVQDKIEQACRVDPTKEYSILNRIVEKLGY